MDKLLNKPTILAEEKIKKIEELLRFVGLE